MSSRNVFTKITRKVALNKKASVIYASILMSLSLTVATAQTALAAPVLPAGFSLSSQPTGLANTAFVDYALLPNGGKITIGKNGSLAFVSASGTPRSLGAIGVHQATDLGLVGIALGCNFTTTGHIYLAYTDPQQNGRVSRYTVVNTASPTGIGNEFTIIGGIKNLTTSHGAGTVVVAPDCTIYAGFGDASSFTQATTQALWTYNLDDPHGKILHVNGQGQGVPGNPYYSSTTPNSVRSKVYTTGLRNPFRFSIDSRNGSLYIGHVGWNQYEMLHVSRAGTNAGWPCYEGPIHTYGFKDYTTCKNLYANPAGVKAAIYAYPHNGVGASITGGVRYKGTAYPAAYQGKYFFGDYARRTISTIRTDVNDTVTSPTQIFGTDLGAPVAFHYEANGNLSYADVATNTIKVINYVAGNRTPIVEATAITNPDTHVVTVDASKSSDPDGDALTYSINFGVGAPVVTTATASRKYTTTDPTKKYIITVSVKDSKGAMSAEKKITVWPANHKPVINLKELSTAPYSPNELVRLQASPTDIDGTDGPLTVSWAAVYRHCPSGGVCHSHPDVNTTGTTFQRAFDSSHASPDTYLEITVTVKGIYGDPAVQVFKAVGATN